jgi:hypothetical protein
VLQRSLGAVGVKIAFPIHRRHTLASVTRV